MKNHYAASVAYDDHNDEWSDWPVQSITYDDLVAHVKEVLTLRKNAEVFFAVYVKDGKEIDITERVRVACQ